MSWKNKSLKKLLKNYPLCSNDTFLARIPSTDDKLDIDSSSGGSPYGGSFENEGGNTKNVCKICGKT